MKGDGHVRHCSDCNLNVYNFSAMSEREIQRLLLAKNARLCARWYRRSDGTILTADCPVGFRARIKKISLVAGTAFSALLGMSTAAAETSGKTSSSMVKVEQSESGSGVIVIRVADATGALIQKAKVTILDSLNKAVVEGETDDAGEFRARGLKPSSYSVRAAFPGFEKSEIDGIVIDANKQWGTTVSVQIELDAAASLGVVVIVRDNPVVEEAGDTPILLPLAPVPDATPVPKPNTVRRLFSKIKGDTK